MYVKYLGHSSFFIKGKTRSVVTDPFGDIGYRMERVTADFCTVSHGHFDHNFTEGVNAAKVVTETADGFFAIDSYHDARLGALRGKNTVFKFDIDGITLCHLGDLGEYYSDRLKEEIGKTDILFIPIGGKYTIDCKEALKYIEGINPRIAIPMHFRTKRSNIDVDGAEEFLKRASGVERVGSEIEIDETSFDDYTKIYFMDGGNF